MKEIKTNGITILLVEVPEDAKEFQIRTSSIGDLFYKTNQNDIGYGKATLPIGQYQILGKSTELSEEQMKEICEFRFGNQSEYLEAGFIDYNAPVRNGFGDKYILNKETVQESYLSLLEANGIVDGNSASHPSDIDPTNRSHYDKIEQEWQQAQSKVKHYLVLKRI